MDPMERGEICHVGEKSPEKEFKEHVKATQLSEAGDKASSTDKLSRRI